MSNDAAVKGKVIVDDQSAAVFASVFVIVWYSFASPSIELTTLDHHLTFPFF